MQGHRRRSEVQRQRVGDGQLAPGDDPGTVMMVDLDRSHAVVLYRADVVAVTATGRCVGSCRPELARWHLDALSCMMVRYRAGGGATLVTRPGHRRAICVVVFAMALAVATATAHAAVPGLPRFQPTPCDLPGGTPEVQWRLDCGTVEVPRDRAAPGHGTFKLAVTVIRTRSARPQPDPVVYIAGGPGSPLTRRAAIIAAHQAEVLAPDRDLVLVDQRGAGQSEPALCPGLAREQLALFAAGLDTAALVQARRSTFAECRRTMARQGLLPGWFGTQVSAADFDDVRQALGIERWSVYALSYGTAVAATMQALHPQGLRAVVLDSVYPPDPLPLTQAQGFGRALAMLFDACGADTACATAHPDLARTYAETLQRLDAEPLRVALPPGLDVGTMHLRAAVFRLVVNRSLYSRPGLAGLPAFIQAAHDRDAAALRPLVARAVRGFRAMSLGIMAAVECRDRASWRTGSPGEAAAPVSAFDGAVCEDWSALGPPVLSARDAGVPTLILSGGADPITPPAFARVAAAKLGGGARLVPFAHVGHGVVDAAPCAEGIVSTFIREPAHEPDTSCAAVIPPVVFR